MNKLTDNFIMNNGLGIPCIGYGTFQSPNDISCDVTLEALKAGYRHVDTAYYYFNEQGVGEAVRSCGIPREEIFVTSKVWNADRGYATTKAAFERTMENLGLDYLDLYLIHWPANRKQFGERAKEINAETWRAMEELVDAGRIRSIGLSNFMPHHIDELMETARIRPAVNQIEFHPGWTQNACVEYCQKNGIIVEAWSPLGRRVALSHPVLTEIAAKYNKSVAQLCIRWVLQHGVLPLPKTVTPERIRENANVFDFEISAADMQAIDALQNVGGQCALPDEVDY